MNLIERINDFIQKQHKVYLEPGQKPPKGLHLQRGRRGGSFYVARTRMKSKPKPKAKSTPTLTQKIAHKTEGKLKEPTFKMPRILYKRIIDGKVYAKIGSFRDLTVAKKKSKSLMNKKEQPRILKETKKDSKGKEYITYTVYKLNKGELPPHGHETPTYGSNVKDIIARYKKLAGASKKRAIEKVNPEYLKAAIKAVSRLYNVSGDKSKSMAKEALSKLGEKATSPTVVYNMIMERRYGRNWREEFPEYVKKN
jgi:hypothetical protein